MIGYAFEEGTALLRRRGAVSLVLALSLAVPLSLAAFTFGLSRWARPLVGLEHRRAVVRVLLHPRMDSAQRRSWVVEQTKRHPEWSVTEIPRDELEQQLEVWFPYLQDLLEGDRPIELPTLIEIGTERPEEVAETVDGPAVIAVGPTSSVNRALGLMARSATWLLGSLSMVLLASAFLLAATWIHLEVYRHGDEITIMRLVGATEGAIRGPFFFAAFVPGLCAGILAALSAGYLLDRVGRGVETLGLVRPEFPGWLAVVVVGLGAGVPALAAAVTLARHARADEGE